MTTTCKKVLILGAGGFIGTWMTHKQKLMGHFVVGADMKRPEFTPSEADEFHLVDLSDERSFSRVFRLHEWDEIYQFAADMGGMGFIGTGDNDAELMTNSVLINAFVCKYVTAYSLRAKVLYTSSACIYPEQNQLDRQNPLCTEESAYPANPDTNYGWEKLYSERMYLAHAKNYNLDFKVVRVHNTFGPYGSFRGGREKAPAALCRKVIQGNLEVWGDGTQTRSFLYIEELIEGLLKIMDSDATGPLNLGSEYLISINDLVDMIQDIAGSELPVKYVKGPQGVNGRVSDNSLLYEKVGWKPTSELQDGLHTTYHWIESELAKNTRTL